MKHFYNYKTQIILIVMLLIFKAVDAQNVGISATGATPPDPSAGLDINFSTRGLLIPNVSLTATNSISPITSPKTSLLVYNTNTNAVTPATAVSPGYYYYSGTEWLRLGTVSADEFSWKSNGNDITSSSTSTSVTTSFLGTTSNHDLVFKANNTEVGRLEPIGTLKVGNASTGTVRSAKELNMRQDGDDYGTSILRMRNRGGENGAVFETATSVGTVSYPPLVDFIFRAAAGTNAYSASPLATSNIRFEGRTVKQPGTLTVGTAEDLARSLPATTETPEWQIGYPVNPTLVISSARSEVGSAVPTGGNSALRFGNFGIGVDNFAEGTLPRASTPTASLHIIRASDGTASTAPIKLTPGVNPSSTPVNLLTTTEAGAIEYDGTDYYVTNTSLTRYSLSRSLDVTTPFINFASTAVGRSTLSTAQTVTGAVVGDMVLVSGPVAASAAGGIFTGYVSTNNNVVIIFSNISGAAIDPANAQYIIKVIKQ
ncbi:MAG: hypothetical protein JWQ25_38 [Daejeonella sp.]|nr:hypothetical protein [Daejeonella sp.]